MVIFYQIQYKALKENRKLILSEQDFDFDLLVKYCC